MAQGPSDSGNQHDRPDQRPTEPQGGPAPPPPHRPTASREPLSSPPGTGRQRRSHSPTPGSTGTSPGTATRRVRRPRDWPPRRW
jgi:hypothetical protein